MGSDSRSMEIMAELAYSDEDQEVLSRFAKQISFEQACRDGEVSLVQWVTRQEEGLLITG